MASIQLPRFPTKYSDQPRDSLGRVTVDTTTAIRLTSSYGLRLSVPIAIGLNFAPVAARSLRFAPFARAPRRAGHNFGDRAGAGQMGAPRGCASSTAAACLRLRAACDPCPHCTSGLICVRHPSHRRKRSPLDSGRTFATTTLMVAAAGAVLVNRRLGNYWLTERGKPFRSSVRGASFSARTRRDKEIDSAEANQSAQAWDNRRCICLLSRCRRRADAESCRRRTPLACSAGSAGSGSSAPARSGSLNSADCTRDQSAGRRRLDPSSARGRVADLNAAPAWSTRGDAPPS